MEIKMKNAEEDSDSLEEGEIPSPRRIPDLDLSDLYETISEASDTEDVPRRKRHHRKRRSRDRPRSRTRASTRPLSYRDRRMNDFDEIRKRYYKRLMENRKREETAKRLLSFETEGEEIKASDIQDVEMEVDIEEIAHTPKIIPVIDVLTPQQPCHTIHSSPASPEERINRSPLGLINRSAPIEIAWSPPSRNIVGEIDLESDEENDLRALRAQALNSWSTPVKPAVSGNESDEAENEFSLRAEALKTAILKKRNSIIRKKESIKGNQGIPVEKVASLSEKAVIGEEGKEVAGPSNNVPTTEVGAVEKDMSDEDIFEEDMLRQQLLATLETKQTSPKTQVIEISDQETSPQKTEHLVQPSQNKTTVVAPKEVVKMSVQPKIIPPKIQEIPKLSNPSLENLTSPPLAIVFEKPQRQISLPSSDMFSDDFVIPNLETNLLSHSPENNVSKTRPSVRPLQTSHSENCLPAKLRRTPKKNVISRWKPIPNASTLENDISAAENSIQEAPPTDQRIPPSGVIGVEPSAPADQKEMPRRRPSRNRAKISSWEARALMEMEKLHDPTRRPSLPENILRPASRSPCGRRRSVSHNSSFPRQKFHTDMIPSSVKQKTLAKTPGGLRAENEPRKESNKSLVPQSKVNQERSKMPNAVKRRRRSSVKSKGQSSNIRTENKEKQPDKNKQPTMSRLDKPVPKKPPNKTSLPKSQQPLSSSTSKSASSNAKPKSTKSSTESSSATSADHPSLPTRSKSASSNAKPKSTKSSTESSTATSADHPSLPTRKFTVGDESKFPKEGKKHDAPTAKTLKPFQPLIVSKVQCPTATATDRIVIRLGQQSDTDSDDEFDDDSEPNSGEKAPSIGALIDAQIDNFLLNARRKTEVTIPATPEAVHSHLPPSQRLEYMRLKQKLAEREKMKYVSAGPSPANQDIAPSTTSEKSLTIRPQEDLRKKLLRKRSLDTPQDDSVVKKPLLSPDKVQEKIPAAIQPRVQPAQELSKISIVTVPTPLQSPQRKQEPKPSTSMPLAKKHVPITHIPSSLKPFSEKTPTKAIPPPPPAKLKLVKDASKALEDAKLVRIGQLMVVYKRQMEMELKAKSEITRLRKMVIALEQKRQLHANKANHAKNEINKLMPKIDQENRAPKEATKVSAASQLVKPTKTILTHGVPAREFAKIPVPSASPTGGSKTVQKDALCVQVSSTVPSTIQPSSASIAAVQLSLSTPPTIQQPEEPKNASKELISPSSLVQITCPSVDKVHQEASSPNDNEISSKTDVPERATGSDISFQCCPVYFTEYKSVLSVIKSPLDPLKEVCPHDLSGVCRDAGCPYQHARF